MARTGRPRIEIDKVQFEKLCAMQCPLDEIAGWFFCSEDTIENWCKRTYKDEKGKPMRFSDVFAIKRQGGKISLRRAQFELAKKSPAMAIFLGKQYLGQRDNIQYEDRESIERLDAILATMKQAAQAAERAEANAVDEETE